MLYRNRHNVYGPMSKEEVTFFRLAFHRECITFYFIFTRAQSYTQNLPSLKKAFEIKRDTILSSQEHNLHISFPMICYLCMPYLR
jgi:hypothetical protein